ncbi:iron chelate uptake ABC transporter family permease subunit [Paracoccus mutanolyticus]|uniref:iron chelate uptake ABC transporter family permease subunit n=1 Tax=Paracoccus mutanolyticus TaxID=1499308 RepID=UPI00294FFF30|nr:iron chelate uptake ABC transporter family permease subunit [Paracoccus mutanolyticus]
MLVLEVLRARPDVADRPPARPWRDWSWSGAAPHVRLPGHARSGERAQSRYAALGTTADAYDDWPRGRAARPASRPGSPDDGSRFDPVEARAHGHPCRPLRLLVIACATLMTAAAVAMAGVIGWVGLMVPHMARLLIGPGFDRLLPASVLIGAGFRCWSIPLPAASPRSRCRWAS